MDIEHPFFGRVFPCRCKVEETMGRYKQWLWGDCGLPADYASVSLTDFRHTTTANRRAAEAAVQYLTGELPTQWLIYQGSYGCGKTHLLAAIVRGFVLQGVHARYVSTAAALENLKEQMGRGGGAFHDVYLSLKRIPVLAVDDLGIEYSTEWARETIEELIDYRYREAMPTVVGTNLRLDEFHPRLRSRLKDDLMCTLVINDSPDYRETHRSSRGGLADAR